jgi:DNA-binding response OmpR family regulator
MEILIVEDEREIAEIIKECLEVEGFSCRVCHDGNSALQLFTQQQPDLIILDLRLPGIDGLEVCTQIRQKSLAHDPYILMLTSRGEEIDRIIGLSTGADDYYVKPFSPRELAARVRALLRRRFRESDREIGVQYSSQLIKTKSFTIDLEQYCLNRHVDSESITLDLSTSEFKLMVSFIKHPGRVWERRHLIKKLWGEDFFGEERVIDTHIARLRKKVELNPSKPQFIKTVVGVGYKFEDI